MLCYNTHSSTSKIFKSSLAFCRSRNCVWMASVDLSALQITAMPREKLFFDSVTSPTFLLNYDFTIQQKIEHEISSGFMWTSHFLYFMKTFTSGISTSVSFSVTYFSVKSLLLSYHMALCFRYNQSFLPAVSFQIFQYHMTGISLLDIAYFFLMEINF